MAADSDPLLTRFAARLSACPLEADASTRRHAAELLLDHLTLLEAAPAVDPAAAAAAELLATTRDAAERAALVAELASAADRDDVHWDALVHPGAVIWATVLEFARTGSPSGREVLRAARIGSETMVRLAAMLPATARGPFHVTALVAPAGVAAAVATLTASTPEVTAAALGHALSVAGGSSGALHELSGTRRFHRAHAVRTGFAAHATAERGLGATARDLEQRRGVFADADAPGDATDAAVLLASGFDALSDTSIRVFPTSGWNQTVYEAARAAASGTELPLSAIEVLAPLPALARSVPRVAALQNPADSIHVAAALGAAAGARDSRDLAELIELVHLEPSVDASATARVTRGTHIAEVTIEVPAGHPRRPAQPADLAERWGLTPHEAEARIAGLAASFDSTDPWPTPLASKEPQRSAR